MSLANRWMATLAAVSSMIACADGSPSPEPAAEEVVPLAQALGGFTPLWSGGVGETPLHVGLTLTVFKASSGGCDQPIVVLTTTGEVLPTQPLPTCARIDAAASSNFDVVVADSSGRTIYSLAPSNDGMTAGSGAPAPIGGSGGAGGSGGGSDAWNPIVVTQGGSITNLLFRTDYVFWKDSTGLYRASSSGGAPSMLKGTEYTPLGIEASTLYVQHKSSGSTYSLRSMPVSGGGTTTLLSQSVAFEPGFTFDANKFYWTEGSGVSGTTHRLRSLTKSGSSLSTVRSSTTERYQVPLSDSSALWWTEVTISTGAVRFRRRSHSNGSVVSVSLPVLAISAMTLTPSAIYVAGLVDGSPDPYVLARTQR